MESVRVHHEKQDETHRNVALPAVTSRRSVSIRTNIGATIVNAHHLVPSGARGAVSSSSLWSARHLPFPLCWHVTLTGVRVRVRHLVDALRGLLQKSTQGSRVSDIPVALKEHPDLDSPAGGLPSELFFPFALSQNRHETGTTYLERQRLRSMHQSSELRRALRYSFCFSQREREISIRVNGRSLMF